MRKEHSYSTDSCALLSNILVLIHTVCSILGRHGQLIIDLMDKSIGVDKSQIVTHHFCKISSHTHAAFTYVPDVLG